MIGERPKPRVICLGHATLDAVFTVESLPYGGGKTPALSYACRGGGMAATAAVAAARLGALAQFWGRAGDDDAGRAMRAELASFDVDVAHLRLFAGARSSVSSVVVDASGERMLVNFRGADLPTRSDWLPLDTVRDADIVLADPRWPEGALALFAHARSAGIPTLFDGDVAEPAVFDALLPGVDYAVFSSAGLAHCVGQAQPALDVEKALRAAYAKGCRVAAVTLGNRGVAWLDGMSLQHLPAFAVDAVDTNGAGDVFHGALAFALGARWQLRDALRFASAVAALKCRHAGARSGVPDFAGAMAFLEASDAARGGNRNPTGTTLR